MKSTLTLLLLLAGCTPRGTLGDGCYLNNTCNDGLMCLRWKDQGGFEKSVCADPKTLNIGGFLVPKECPDPPDLGCAPCEPGWKRGPR